MDEFVIYSCRQSGSSLLVNYHFVAWLADDMKVKVQFYDDKPLSASVPKRVSCIVKEVIAATPRYVSLFIVVLKESSLCCNFLFAIFSNLSAKFSSIHLPVHTSFLITFPSHLNLLFKFLIFNIVFEILIVCPKTPLANFFF